MNVSNLLKALGLCFQLFTTFKVLEPEVGLNLALICWIVSTFKFTEVEL